MGGAPAESSEPSLSTYAQTPQLGASGYSWGFCNFSLGSPCPHGHVKFPGRLHDSGFPCLSSTSQDKPSGSDQILLACFLAPLNLPGQSTRVGTAPPSPVAFSLSKVRERRCWGNLVTHLYVHCELWGHWLVTQSKTLSPWCFCVSLSGGPSQPWEFSECWTVGCISGALEASLSRGSNCSSVLWNQQAETWIHAHKSPHTTQAPNKSLSTCHLNARRGDVNWILD